ncbi:hypothetical protein [Vibrio sp. 10N.261.46.A3]|uniref:hypothetical protein n=1 Tax=Vibrio sp. 10N.261.46.A3 TaxID=3229658 RepID=UPI00355448AB
MTDKENETNNIPEIEQAKIRQINSEIRLREFGFCQRWLIIWLTVGGVLKFEIVKEVASWISG